jgi:YbbR domain-containing protein
MSSIFSKIARFIKKTTNDRRIIVFTVCLIIATSLWFLDALSKDYATTLSYPVKYVNPPKNLFLSNTPPSKLDLRVRAHGFTLLRHKLALSFSPLLLDLTTISHSIDSTATIVEVTAENLIRRIGSQISNEISISDVSPRTISLQFDSLQTRVVQVLPDINLNFKPQFFMSGEVTIEPDSVILTGPAALLDTIRILYTEPRTFNDLETSIVQSVRVYNPRRTNLSPERVTLHVPVEKFTEKKITIPVQVINMPENIQIKLFPPQVNVSFMVGLSNYDNVTANDFSAIVDFSQTAPERETLEVKVESKTSYIQSIKASPAAVEYLIETD